MVVETLGPGLIDVVAAGEEFAGLAVQQIVEAVAVGVGDELSPAAADFGVKEDWDVRRVPIVDVVRGELEVPFELAGVAVERDEGTGIEIVAGAGVAIPIGGGIADAPVEEVQRGVVGAGDPSGAATGFPGVVLPGFVAGFAGFWNGMEAPFPLACFCMVGVEPTTDAGFAAAGADDDFVLDREGGDGEATAEFVISGFDGPTLNAAAGV